MNLNFFQVFEREEAGHTSSEAKNSLSEEKEDR